jgi:hypothetical protein
VTQPAEPAPGAPANAPNPNPQPGPEPAPPAPVSPPAPATEDVSALPEWAQRQIRDLRAEAGKSRTTAKQTAADEARTEMAAQIAKALGIQTGEQPPDPAALTKQIEQAQAQAWRSGVELQVHRFAGRLGGNADALLDSLSFIDSLDDLTEVDPRSADFATQLEAKVQAAMERNPAYRATGQANGQAPNPAGTPRPDPSQGARGAGPSIDSRIAEAQAKGDWRTVISLQNQKLNIT